MSKIISVEKSLTLKLIRSVKPLYGIYSVVKESGSNSPPGRLNFNMFSGGWRPLFKAKNMSKIMSMEKSLTLKLIRSVKPLYGYLLCG